MCVHVCAWARLSWRLEEVQLCSERLWTPGERRCVFEETDVKTSLSEVSHETHADLLFNVQMEQKASYSSPAFYSQSNKHTACTALKMNPSGDSLKQNANE